MGTTKGIILLPPERRELDGLFQQLGIQRELPQFLTEEDAEKAHLPFNFFEAFASLTEGGRPPQSLVAYREKRLEVESGAEENPLTSLDQRWFIRAPFFNSTFTVFKPEIIKIVPTQNELLEMDPAEARVLISALRLLGRDNPTESAPEKETIEETALARIRIQHLGVEECWLKPKEMRAGLFGSVNGESSHQIGGVYLKEEILYRETTKAYEFTCPYLPLMEGLINGLSFVTDAMPPRIQKAAQSVAILEMKGSTGSGVVVEPKYILTNLHVIKDKENPTPNTIHLKIRIGEETIDCDAEVIEISSRAAGYQDPDLALLYVPNLPPKVKPLSFSKRKHPEGKTLFVIGAPVQQEEPVNLLVTSGKITNSTITNDGRVTMTAPFLPGNSGGAIVDSNGDLVGVAVSILFDSEFKEMVGGYIPPQKKGYIRPWRAEKTRIIGGQIYPTSIWGEAIHHAIRKDQKRRKPK